MITANVFTQNDSENENSTFNPLYPEETLNENVCPNALVLKESKETKNALTNEWNCNEVRKPFGIRTSVSDSKPNILNENLALVPYENKNVNSQRKEELDVRDDERRIVLGGQSTSQELTVYHGSALQKSTSSREIIMYDPEVNSNLISIKQDMREFEDLLAMLKNTNENNRSIEHRKKFQVMLGSVEELSLKIKCNLNITGIKINQTGSEQSSREFDDFQGLKKEFRKNHTIFHKFASENSNQTTECATNLYGDDDGYGGNGNALVVYDSTGKTDIQRVNEPNTSPPTSESESDPENKPDSGSLQSINIETEEVQSAREENSTENDEKRDQPEIENQESDSSSFQQDLQKLRDSISQVMFATKEMIFNGCGTNTNNDAKVI